MFEKVAIVGLGLLGGSLARELKHRRLASTVYGVCRSDASKKLAQSLEIVDHVVDLPSAIEGADLVVLATPMQSMLPIIKSMEALFSKNTIITDVGSVKVDLYTQLKQECPQLLPRFVLAHPIAGGEDSGVMASLLGLFEGKNLIITQSDEVEAAPLERVRQLWEQVGAQVITMSLQQHDAIFAKTSHLPHVVAYSLVNYLAAQDNNEQLFSLAAAGFYDFSRIASSNAEMWRDICMTNRVEILNAVDGFIEQMQSVRKSIADSDQAKVLSAFQKAKAARDVGLKKKSLSK